MNNHLAYVLGVILGDGYTTGGNRVGLKVTDKNFASYFKDKILKVAKKCDKKKNIKIKKRKPYGKQVKPVWNCILYSKKNCRFIEKKLDKIYSTKFKKEEKISLIRGLFDSEGSIYFNREKHVKKFTFSNMDKNIIDFWEKLLDYFNVNYLESRNKIHGVYNVNSFSWKDFFFFKNRIGFRLKNHKKKWKQLSKYWKEVGWMKSKVDENEVKKYVKNGLSDKQIAEKLGFHKITIGRIRRKIGLKPNIKWEHPNKLNREEIKKLHSKGLIGKQIAKKLGCHPYTINNIIRELGLSSNYFKRINKFRERDEKGNFI